MKKRFNLRDLAIGSALVISLLSAFGWQWSTPGKAMRDLEARTTLLEKRADSTTRYVIVLTYLNCVKREPAPNSEAQLLLNATCNNAAAALERP